MTQRGQISALEIAQRLNLNSPTEQQIRIIEAPLEPLLVVAGAGSGKTETMSARVVYLVANGLVRPEQVLGLTFTRKAAGELQERISDRLHQLRKASLFQGDPQSDNSPLQTDALDLLLGAANAHVSTYNSFAANIVAEHGLKIGINGSRILLRPAAAWQLMHDVVSRWPGDLNVEGAMSTIESAVEGLAGQCADHLLSHEVLDGGLREIVEHLSTLPPNGKGKYTANERDIIQKLSERRALVPLLREYEQRKIDNESMDFSDQVTLAAKIVENVPDVVSEYRDLYRVVLLDEFQDTSHGQLELLRQLFGDGHATTAVGDPQQSIYGWRGASASGLAAFRHGFGSRIDPDREARELTRQYDLSTSWRNDQVILSVANRIAAPLREDSERADVPVQQLEARPQAGPGRVEARYFEDAQLEANYIADTIADLEQIRVTNQSEGRDPEIKTIAILVRARSSMPRLERTLRARGLSVSVAGLGGLLHVPEVADLRAFLEVAHDPSRGDALMRLLNGPKYRLGSVDIAVLSEFAKHIARESQEPGLANSTPQGKAVGSDQATSDQVAANVPDVVDSASIVDAVEGLTHEGHTDRFGRSLSRVAVTRLQKLASSLRRVRSLTAVALPDLVHFAIQELGVDIEARVSFTGASDAAVLDLLAFEQEAETFAREAAYPRLGAFLSWLDAAEVREKALEPSPDIAPVEGSVSLLTMHAAKGLEWDLTFVPGLYTHGFPSRGKEGSLSWLKALSQVPHFLRGDRHSLPSFPWADLKDQGEVRDALAEFKTEVEEWRLREERRLAYVAFTRARKRLVITTSRWYNETVKKPAEVSIFLHEVAGVSGVEVDPDLARALELHFARAVLQEKHNAAKLARDEQEMSRLSDALIDLEVGLSKSNPIAQDSTWAEFPRPLTPLAHAFSERANEVHGAVQRWQSIDLGPADLHADVLSKELSRGLSSEAAVQVRAWVQDATVLVAEAQRKNLRADQIEVVIPPHISASDLVNWCSEPEVFLEQKRRRTPRRPNPHARRGTQFHAALEQRFKHATLLGPEDLGEDKLGVEDLALAESSILELLDVFEQSRWAHRTPAAVEEAFELPLAGLTIRGSIDAVYTDLPEDSKFQVEIVDWKTGRPARSAREKEAREVQLAMYRLAWHERTGVPLDQIRAGFYYAADAQEAWADNLPDAEQLSQIISSRLDNSSSSPHLE